MRLNCENGKDDIDGSEGIADGGWKRMLKADSFSTSSSVGLSAIPLNNHHVISDAERDRDTTTEFS